MKQHRSSRGGHQPRLTLRTIALLLVAVLAAGCGRRREPGATELTRASPFILLDVRNHSFFDVVISALPSPVSETRIRLGNVIGFTDTELRVPREALREGWVLVLHLHAIGSSLSWVSPEVLLSVGVRPCLDIHASLAGDLSRSFLYSRFVPDSTPTAPDSSFQWHCPPNSKDTARAR